MKLRALLVLFTGLLPALAEEPAWQPATTWVFAVGILKFDDPGLHGWPDKGRVDAVMLDALRERGVPDDHVLFLKNEQATHAQVRDRFAEFLRRAAAGDTLIFYYAGHGGRDYRDPARAVKFLTYDTKAGWPVRAVLDAIETNFTGARVLLTADCCHSGALADEAARRSGRISYGVLTSARASATSTGNWTFTQCLADLFRGDPLLDLDRNGRITFAEAARYCDLEMASRESQRATHFASGKFPPDLVLARATGERRKGLEDRERLKAKTLADATKVEIEWRRTWYPGHVVRSELGLLLVHYDGYTAADDEWVPMSRVRVRE